jgi:hypothetical protein
MTAPVCEIEELSLVLVGRCNPAIFHPAWLAGHSLIREAEAQAAVIEIIRPEIAIFSVGAFQVQVTAERFSLVARDGGQSKPLKDLAMGAFEILAETPLFQLGINRQMHFRLPSTNDWHAVGHRLLPKTVFEGLVDEPGTKNATIWGKRPRSTSTRIQVAFEPSSRIPQGVFVSTNEHFDFGEEQRGAAAAVAALRAHWDEAQGYAASLGRDVLGRLLEEPA